MAPLIGRAWSTLTIAALFAGLTLGQDPIPIAANSLEQVASDNFLDGTCLSGANPDVTALAAGDTFLVPLDCCGGQSFTCGGAFCIELVECDALETGVGSIPITTTAATLTGSVTGAGATTTITDTAATATSTDGAAIVVPPPAGTNGADTPEATGGTTDEDTPDTDTPESDEPADESDPEETVDPTTTTAQETTAETQASSTAPASTSSGAESSATPFLIGTKQDTARSDFDALIKALPDKGEGGVIAYENIPWQAYVTFNLSAEEVSQVKSNEIVEFVGEIKEDDGQAGVISGTRQFFNKRADGDETSPRAASDHHLGILSAPKDQKNLNVWPDYEFDSVLGAGSTIYVIDTGYQSDHSVCHCCLRKPPA